MLYVITLIYRRSETEREKHNPGHKAWLVDHIKAGSVIFAGPLENQRGGLILAVAPDEHSVRNRLGDDPFVAAGLVDVEVTGVHPALVSSAFLSDWGSDTKVIAVSDH